MKKPKVITLKDIENARRNAKGLGQRRTAPRDNSGQGKQVITEAQERKNRAARKKIRDAKLAKARAAAKERERTRNKKPFSADGAKKAVERRKIKQKEAIDSLG